MATPRLTQKDMTEAEQRELKTLLDRARIAHGRTLTNAETNQVKKEYIDKLMAQRDAAAKKARKLKKEQAYKPDAEATFSWSATTSTRGRRESAPFLFAPRLGKALSVARLASPFLFRLRCLHHRALNRLGFRFCFSLRLRF